MNNSNIIIKQSRSDYYGIVNYRLLLIHDFMKIINNMVASGVVDREHKEYIGFYVPRNIKESLKHRDHISFSHYYVSEYRKLFPSYTVIPLSDDIRGCYAFYGILSEDNQNWDYKGTGYYKLTKKKKLPISTPEKYIEKFYKKYGNYFPQYDFTTIEECEEYFYKLYPDNKP